MASAAPLAGRRAVVFGSGWIAANLYRHLRVSGWSCRVCYRKYRNPLVDPQDLFELPDSQPALEAWLRDAQPHHVVIAGGTSFVAAIERDVATSLDLHVSQTVRVLSALAVLPQRPERILTVGSASEYGGRGLVPLAEHNPLQPKDAYGFIKAAQGSVAASFFQHSALPVIHVRQFNASGVGQSPAFVLPSIVRQVVAAVASDAGTCRVSIGDLDAVRDFIDIRDVVTAYETLLTSGAEGTCYNVCSGRGYAIGDALTAAAGITGRAVVPEVDASLVRPKGPTPNVLIGDCSRLRELGWAPRFGLTDILQSMFDAAVPNPGPRW